MAKIANIKNYDVANGEGIRISVFFSGCSFFCKGCFNKDVWDFNVGEDFNLDYYHENIYPNVNKFIRGLSVLGGEPLHPKNIYDVALLIALFKYDFSERDIWLWTGYKFEDLLKMKDNDCNLKYILSTIDVLIDGQFILEEKDLTLKWRGSRNQRVIDVPKSLTKGEVVLYEI